MRKKNKLDHFSNLGGMNNQPTWIERAVICIFIVAFILIITQFTFMGIFGLKIYNNLDSILNDSRNMIHRLVD